ncbi:MAG TPA: hypothetical protein DER40_07450 [Geobacter sp.]|nr:hypothetical protein [Geobacter sp.]HCE67345.1 hypothetical protein [Geobacter sp.]
MSGIVAMARQWLAGEQKVPGNQLVTHQHIIESLLAEIKRIEDANAKLNGEVQRLKSDGVKELRFAVAEECAVICETADYVIRSYGCAMEIRKKFGLPLHK